MSDDNKPKTPRELADLYCKDFDPHDYGISEISELLHSTYLTALEAGARMGWDARNAETTLEDGCKLRTWAYFNEWWASLEGEK